jgi:Gly-Xaa carboxypeptidase
MGEHAADIPCYKKHLIRKSLTSNRALRKLQELGFRDSAELKAKVGTTQAIDIIAGGVKANALPESAEAIINHRIAVDRYAFF